jgi:isoleucyl-tRNA synthetase
MKEQDGLSMHSARLTAKMWCRVPQNVGENRFGNWLANARDWNVSRNRYWGTPMPLWVSDDMEEV